MKKKWWFAAIAVLALCGGVSIVVVVLLPSGPGVTKANFDRIEDGMTGAEVESILGAPGDPQYRFTKGGVVRIEVFIWSREDDARAGVEFVNGGAKDKGWADSNETISDKLRRWLSLPRK